MKYKIVISVGLIDRIDYRLRGSHSFVNRLQNGRIRFWILQFRTWNLDVSHFIPSDPVRVILLLVMAAATETGLACGYDVDEDMYCDEPEGQGASHIDHDIVKIVRLALIDLRQDETFVVETQTRSVAVRRGRHLSKFGDSEVITVIDARWSHVTRRVAQ